MNGSHGSKYQFVKQAPVKQLSTNHLWLHVISFSNLQIWKKWHKKETSVVQAVKQFKQFKKLILLKNIYSRTQLLNTSKIQNILPKMKTYSLSIKIGLPGKRTFKSSLWVLLPNFIRSEPFDTQNEDISLPNQSTLHLDHKCLY